MEGQSVEELLAKAERDEAEKLQRITVQKALELSPSVESCGCGLGPSPGRLG